MACQQIKFNIFYLADQSQRHRSAGWLTIQHHRVNQTHVLLPIKQIFKKPQNQLMTKPYKSKKKEFYLWKRTSSWKKKIKKFTCQKKIVVL